VDDDLSDPARTERGRHPRRPGYAALVVLVIVGGGAAVSALLSMDTEDHAGSASSRTVTCPDGEVVETLLLDDVRVPAFESPREAAEGWAGPGAGEVTVSSDDRFAYLHREDGSTRAKMRLDSTRVDLDEGEPTSWWVNGSEVCSDETSTRPWNGSEGVACPAGGKATARVTYPPSGDRRSADGGLGFADPRHDKSEVQLSPGAKSGDVTATMTGPSGAHTWLRLLRVDDTWRIAEVIACARDLPGLPTTGTPELVSLIAGHCWVNPLTFDGRDWALPQDQQFGWGGAMPDRWVGYGTVAPDDDGLHYVDAGGAYLDLLPADDPRTELPGGGLCA
jgi:hypothetical protein